VPAQLCPVHSSLLQPALVPQLPSQSGVHSVSVSAHRLLQWQPHQQLLG
jgi:hypothetical protein